MTSFLEIKDLTVYYNRNEPAIEHLSLKLEKNEILAVVGESGSGKSTLIRAIMGLLSGGGIITSGHIYFNGKDLVGLSLSQYRSLRGNKIAMVFQDARGCLNPRRKIGSQFIESLRSHVRLSVSDARGIALLVLTDMHLPDPERIMNSYTFELSGGMCQRIALAMAISDFSKPELLLADEPTSTLDVVIQEQVIRQILGYRERYGVSIIIVTHNFGIAAYIADSIAVMHNGRLVEWGARDQVIFEPRHEYTRSLLEAVPCIQ
ncbi:MAG: ABC transporter ATP-binding protein [Peptococcaceae bacterium]|jgi:peptide/nickel transport system ATP-binding protein|nr:ABC transporter ATP-binding protein [Peptococcaceae bacterium]